MPKGKGGAKGGSGGTKGGSGGPKGIFYNMFNNAFECDRKRKHLDPVL